MAVRSNRSRPGPGDAERVDLVGLSVDAAVPSALECQRRAHGVIERVRAACPAEHLTATFGGTPLEIMDLLLFDVLRAGGAALGAALLLAEVPPPAEGSARRHLPHRAPELQVAAGVLNRRRPTVRLDTPAGRAADVRQQLFVAKQQATTVVRASKGARPPITSIDVVATAQVPHHVHDAHAVLARLRDDGLTVGFVVGDARTADAVAAAGFDVVGGLDLAPLDAVRAVVIAHRLRRRLRQVIDRLGGDLASQAVGAAIDRVLAAQLHQAFAFAASVGPVLRDGEVRAVLTPNPASIAGRATSRLAQDQARPVIGLEHGSIFPGDPRWFDLPVTTMCVWGETSRRSLLACGVPDESIVVTGASRFDADGVAPAAPAGRDVPAVPEAGKVLVATSGPGDHVSLDTHLRFIDVLSRAVELGTGVRWIVKLHPKDDPGLYERLATRADVDVVGADRTGRTSIYDHLATASCLVTVSSVTAIDALRVRVPVLCVWTAGEEPPPPFIERSSARVVTDAVGLAAGVLEAAAGELAPADPAFLGEYLAHPGEATERICREIHRALRGRSR